jgi:hypothetical protein
MVDFESQGFTSKDEQSTKGFQEHFPALNQRMKEFNFLRDAMNSQSPE